MKINLLLLSSILLIILFQAGFAQPVIINHLSTDIREVPANWIDSAKNKLHIVYGHTSHGSQVTDGMTGLVDFVNAGGKGLSLPQNFFTWNDGGTDGALDLYDDYNIDAGYYPDWYDRTVSFLTDTSFSNVNVYMWSWCGQISGKYSDGILYSDYITPMNLLEQVYPGVKFVYMTGHLDHWDDANNKAANDSLRRYCQREGKILFDFSDIESYNPDGQYFEFADDACNYYTDAADSEPDGNWAEEWRAAHTENTDWYNCSAAHSDPLNGNQKAYAAWWMWARLAGWDGTTGIEERGNDVPAEFTVSQNFPNPFNPATTIQFTLKKGGKVILKVYNILGKEVATLVDGYKNGGISHTVRFDAAGLASGVYFYRLQTAEETRIRKMVYIR